MKKIFVKSFTVLMAIAVCSVFSFAQKSERVKFAKGETSGNYTRTLSANGSMDFIINAKAGQYMDYTVAYDMKKSDIEAFLTEPGMQDVSQTPTIDARNVFQINKTGDHRLTVNNMTRKSVTITLYLQITDEDPDADEGDGMSAGKTVDMSLPNTERVKFPAGSIEVNLEKTVAANNAKRFVFWAKAGQEIAFTVTPKRKNATLSIDLDGEEATVGELFTIIAPKTGDYMIQILNADKMNQAFTLDLGIAAQ